MSNAVKKVSLGIMMGVVGIATIGLIVATLLGVWNTGSTPVAYVVVDVMNNTNVELPECDAPRMTVLRNIATKNISYQCGDLGKISEIVTLYE
jgi:hypothetical protein